MVCQPCDAAERHGGRARAFAALSSDAGNASASWHEIVWRRDGDSRLSDRPLWTLAQQEPSHPLIVSTTLNTEVSQRLQSLLPDIFSHCQIRLTDESELFLRLYCAVAVRRIREGIRYRNAWQRRSMKKCAMRRMRLRSYYNSWPTSRCRSRK